MLSEFIDLFNDGVWQSESAQVEGRESWQDSIGEFQPSSLGEESRNARESSFTFCDKRKEFFHFLFGEA